MTDTAVYEGVTWYDARDFGLRGQSWQDEARELPYDRFPVALQSEIESGLWRVSTYPAGLYVDFIGAPCR